MSLLYPHGKADADHFSAVQPSSRRGSHVLHHGGDRRLRLSGDRHRRSFRLRAGPPPSGKRGSRLRGDGDAGDQPAGLHAVRPHAPVACPHRLGSLVRQVARTAAALAIGIGLTFAIVWSIARPDHLTVPVLASWFALAVWLFVGWRCLLLWFAGKASFRPLLRRRTVLVSSAGFVREMNAHLGSRMPGGFQVVGTFDPASEIDRESETPSSAASATCAPGACGTVCAPS